MRKIITYKDLKDIIVNPYRRIIIYSPIKLPGFKNNACNNYIENDKIEETINEYMKCLKNTEKDILPYLFIFNKYQPVNKEFLDHSNWFIIKDDVGDEDDFLNI